MPITKATNKRDVTDPSRIYASRAMANSAPSRKAQRDHAAIAAEVYASRRKASGHSDAPIGI